MSLEGAFEWNSEFSRPLSPADLRQTTYDDGRYNVNEFRTLTSKPSQFQPIDGLVVDGLAYRVASLTYPYDGESWLSYVVCDSQFYADLCLSSSLPQS